MSTNAITLDAKKYRGVLLDRLIEVGPRGGVHTYWRRADRRESAERLIATWDHTQRAAAAR